MSHYELWPQNDYMKYIAKAMHSAKDGPEQQWRIVRRLIDSPLLTKQNKRLLQEDHIKLSFDRLRKIGSAFEKSLERFPYD